MAGSRTKGSGRETVLRQLRESPVPLTVSDIAGSVGLHPNTVRGHLELLVHLGFASREKELRTERGRPRIMYRQATASDSDADAYLTLATVLASELSMVTNTDQTSSDAAGTSWARQLVAEGRLQVTGNPTDGVAEVTQLFDELGFETATEPLGDRLYLQSCPYSAIRSSFPGVCELHLGLLRGALTATGSGLGVTQLDVEPRPGLCIAHLRQIEQSSGERP